MQVIQATSFLKKRTQDNVTKGGEKDCQINTFLFVFPCFNPGILQKL